MKPMLCKSILLVSHELTYTGAPRSLLNMADVLRELGWQVDIWTCKRGEFQEEFNKKGYRVDFIDFENSQWLYKLKEYQVAVFNTVFTAELCVRAQCILRSILFIREAGNISQLVRECGISEKTLRNINEIFCVSDYAKRMIRLQCHSTNIRVIHNWVKDESFHRMNWVKDSMIHYLVSGTVEYRKGIDIAVQAFLNMPEILRSITTLHIVGRVPEWSHDYWEQVVPKNNKRIIFHGEIQNERERMELYKKMNVFVVSSRDEACSLVALEGAMLGKVVIMSENVGAQYVLKDNSDCLYEVENVAQLTRKMSQFTSRRKLLVEGLMMRKRYLETSTKKIYRKKLEEYIT
ncbi:glycosyltransferase family 4 protein [Coprococcus catus]|uniref:glycosyltransferase family 4 protein n=1 Tax=Coprococcus catus TaxID=116085 RepID=UPI001C8BE8D4|nr:glycosyltransferase family 4 protein [Coprococcus catus]MCT6800972.1 glycosyltransferase family 4 protein [Coprococcus catus]